MEDDRRNEKEEQISQDAVENPTCVDLKVDGIRPGKEGKPLDESKEEEANLQRNIQELCCTQNRVTMEQKKRF